MAIIGDIETSYCGKCKLRTQFEFSSERYRYGKKVYDIYHCKICGGEKKFHPSDRELERRGFEFLPDEWEPKVDFSVDGGPVQRPPRDVRKRQLK